MTFQLGDYQAIELIARGRAAQVWRGISAKTGHAVALKVYPAVQLAAVRREAALAALVDHPHVVRVLDVAGDDERAALITEFAVGGDLSELLERRTRLTVGETLTVLLPLAAALATAHERQVVHGDVAAQNVLFDRAGRPLLADLGAGRAAAESGREVCLTPADAAPELARGGSPTPATDVFGLGSVALACLTGRPAWPADDLRDVLIQAAAGQWPDPGADAGPPELVRTIRAMLEHDADRRPGAATVVMDLQRAGRPEPVDLAHRLGRPAAPAAVVLGSTPEPSDTPGPTPDAVQERSSRHRAGASDEDDPPAGRPLPGDGGERLEFGRIARARAVTRLRPDAVPLPTAAPERGLGRMLSVARSGRAPRLSGPADGRSQPGRSTLGGGPSTRGRRGLRWAMLAGVAALVTAVAVAGGLWWANWDRTDPASAAMSSLTGAAQDPPLSRPTTSAIVTSRPAPSGSRPAHSVSPRTSGSVQPSAAAAPTGSVSLPSSTSPAVLPPAPDPPAPDSPATDPPTSRPTPSGSLVSSPAQSTSTAQQQDWTVTVRSLDAARSRALVSRDPTLLDAVYTRNSAARAADAKVIASLVAGGLRLAGAEHRVQSARVVGRSPLRVEVDDSLPSYQVVDAAGHVVGQTAGRPAAARVMVLTPTATGYRISSVQSTGT